MAKNKQIKFAEMEVLKNVFQPKHKEIFQTDYFLKGHWQEKIFQNNHPIVLEIGCGKGEYTVGLSQLYPEKNFIGIDIKGARMWHGAKQPWRKDCPMLFSSAFMQKCWNRYLLPAKYRKSGLRFRIPKWQKPGKD